MTEGPLFTPQEYEGRLSALRRLMDQRDLDIALVSQPENIFYLTGLDHWGYFAPHLLIVPGDGELVLVTRAMERVTVSNQVRNARFEGHGDQETAADVGLRVLRQAASPRRRRIGLEKWSSGLPFGLATALVEALPDSSWHDITGLVDGLRQVKSPAEQAYMRSAAKITDAATAAALAAIGVGARENEIAAACQKAMTAAGGSFPGFGPFVRSTRRLGEEHTSWGEAALAEGDAVFLELSGSVSRYHAPLGRLVHVGRLPEGTEEMAELCGKAFGAVLDALRPGARARQVYAAWQGVVDDAGLAHYRRHHCGYLVGIGVPPTWTGGNGVTGLRSDSDLEIRTGMTIHILSWLMGTGARGDYFVSDTVLLGEKGPEILTRTPTAPSVRN
ncbi:MAG: M24 family metallopeptidase [Kiloniellales bacterium]